MMSHLLRLIGGSGGLLIALTLALALAPQHLPGPHQVETVLRELALQLISPPPPQGAPGIIRLPTAPTASPALQEAGMRRLLESVPLTTARLVLLPDAGLDEALRWSPLGQELRAALQAAGAITEPSPLQAASPLADWRAALATRLNAAERAEQAIPLVDVSGAEPLASPLVAAFAAENAERVIWRAGHGLAVGTGAILTGSDGLLYPNWSAFAVRASELRPESLAGATPPVVLIGAEGDPRLDDAATAITALESRAYSYSPWWSAPLDKALLALLLLHFLFAVPRLPTSSGLLLTLLVGLAVLAAQYGLQLARNQWLGLGPTYCLLLAGYPIACLSAWARRDRQRQRRTAESALLDLARYQLRQGELEPARRQLMAAAPSQQRLELLYEAAIGYERRRQYAQARELFAACARQDKGFRDVQQRLTVLAQVSGPAAARIGSAGTLVMPQGSVEKPLLGRYRLERELGRGGMGIVYLGVDPRIGRQVAIKTLDMAWLPSEESEEFKARFFREAEAAGRLSHPNIVTIYDVGEEGDLAFMAMDYVQGRPLGHYTDREQLLPVGTVYTLIAQVAEALEYAHAEGVVHRDIKPANLMYDAERDVLKITDFGIARLVDSRRTNTGAILGSPSYMAPEQISGDKVSGAADVFSLGVSFFELLTGELPFKGESLAQLAMQISQGKHPDVRKLRPELPASASRIIARALKKNSAERYAHAGEMAEALRRAVTAANRKAEADA